MSIYPNDADTTHRVLSIEAEIDAIMNQPTTRKWNEQKKATALAYWREKLAHYSLLLLSEVAIQCKQESTSDTEYECHVANKHRQEAKQ